MLFVRRCCLTYNLMRGMATGNKSHYDSLGVKANATQGEIKTAYYELSKQFHPDRNKGSDESLYRFRQVTDAYEILGNVKSRKMYDRGLVVGSSGTTLRQDVPDDPDTKFYKQREKRNQVPTAPGGSTVYDFDAWSKAHYSKNAERRQSTRNLYEFRQSIKLEQTRKLQVYKTAIVGVLIISVFVAASEKLLQDNYDEVVVKDKKELTSDVT